MNQIDNFNSEETAFYRPKVITVLCWITIIFSLWEIVSSINFLANYENNVKLFEETYDGSYMVKKLFSPGAIVSSIILNIPIIIGAFGLFKMKKWGAWVFIGANIILALVRFNYSEHIMHEIGISPYISFIVPGICIGIVLYFYKYFSGNSDVNSLEEGFNTLKNKVTSNTFTAESGSNNVSKENYLLEEIEKLFQMKEKGIISDEDFKLMKEKIININ